MQIYIYRDGHREGPYTREQVMAGLTAGTFLATDLAWRNGVPNWTPIQLLLTANYEYHCASCGSTATPTMFRRISSGGWVFFFVFLLLCLPISLFGFLIKEEYSVCPACGTQRTVN